MKYYTSYYSKVARIDTSKLLLVKISASAPDWFKKELYSFGEAVPSWQLITAYKTGNMTSMQYEDVYGKQLDDININAYKNEFERICAEKGYEGVVFLCWEGPKKFCHRYTCGKRFDAVEL